MSCGVPRWSVGCRYVRYPQSAEEPFSQLRGFKSVRLEAGATAEVSFELTDRWLSVWDVETHSWELVRGTHELRVGSSIADIRLTGSLVV